MTEVYVIPGYMFIKYTYLQYSTVQYWSGKNKWQSAYFTTVLIMLIPSACLKL